MIVQAVLRWIHLLCIFCWLFALTSILARLSAADPTDSALQMIQKGMLNRWFLWLWEISALVLITGFLTLLLHTGGGKALFSRQFLLLAGLKLSLVGLITIFQAYGTRLLWQLHHSAPKPVASPQKTLWLLKLMLWLTISLVVPVSLLGVILRYF